MFNRMKQCINHHTVLGIEYNIVFGNNRKCVCQVYVTQKMYNLGPHELCLVVRISGGRCRSPNVHNPTQGWNHFGKKCRGNKRS